MMNEYGRILDSRIEIGKQPVVKLCHHRLYRGVEFRLNGVGEIDLFVVFLFQIGKRLEMLVV